MSEGYKKAVSNNTGDNTGNSALYERLLEVDEDGNFTNGVAGTALIEPVPERINTESEVIFKNANNASIVLGRDRPSHTLSGYGGVGDTQCASIDIVCGHGGAEAASFEVPEEATNEPDSSKVYVDPNFEKDAARIYLSQKTDIFDNFGIVKTKYNEVTKPKSKSGIGIKADNILIGAREGIKIVTSLDDSNSQSGANEGHVGIELIARNSNQGQLDIQPIPKGDNLLECIDRLATHVDKLNGVVDSFINYQTAFNAEITMHTHKSPFFGQETSPSISVVGAGMKTIIDTLTASKRSLVLHKINLETFKNTFLKKFDGKYILSRYNKTN